MLMRGDEPQLDDKHLTNVSDPNGEGCIRVMVRVTDRNK